MNVIVKTMRWHIPPFSLEARSKNSCISTSTCGMGGMCAGRCVAMLPNSVCQNPFPGGFQIPMSDNGTVVGSISVFKRFMLRCRSVFFVADVVAFYTFYGSLDG